MANDITLDPGYQFAATPADYPVMSPTTAIAGQAVLIGSYITGLALTNLGEGGNTAAQCTVDIGPFLCSVPVTNTEGNLSVGDLVFYDTAIHGLNNNSNGVFFGITTAAVTGSKQTVSVRHFPYPGGIALPSTILAANLGANSVTTAKIAAGAVLEANLDPETNLTLNAKRTARFVWDFATDGGVAGTIAFRGAALPSKARIVSGECYIKTALTGAGGTTASIQVTGANDIIADAAVAGVPWSTADAMVPVVPVNTTATCVKVEAGGSPSLVVTTHNLGAGHIDLFLNYVIHD